MSLESLLVDFRALVSSKQNDKAQTKLVELKKALLELNSLPPMSMNTPFAKQERALAQEALEYAAILSINVGDKDAFQRSITSLRPYYCDYKENDAKSVGSDMTMTVVGLNLLYLLVENRLADFHCELELLSEAQQTHPYVTFCTQLDQHLVVGSYDQVLTSAASPPVAYYSFFLTSLLETVRLNIGECVSAAYDSLTVQAATQILMFTTTEV